MTRFVILDTNVVVSALLAKFDHGYPAAVLDRVASRNVTPAYSWELLSEYEDVLRRPKFKFEERDIQAVLRIIKRFGVHQEPLPGLSFTPECIDENDRFAFNLMLSTDALLITGNVKDFPKDSHIFTPAEFIRDFTHA